RRSRAWCCWFQLSLMGSITLRRPAPQRRWPAIEPRLPGAPTEASARHITPPPPQQAPAFQPTDATSSLDAVGVRGKRQHATTVTTMTCVTERDICHACHGPERTERDVT